MWYLPQPDRTPKENQIKLMHDPIFQQEITIFLKKSIFTHLSHCDLVWTHYKNNERTNQDLSQESDEILVQRQIDLNSATTRLHSGAENVPKLRTAICSVVIIISTTSAYDSNNPGLQLFQTLTPHFLPLTRKDEDYYIFFGQNELMASPEFGLKIKYKIGFYLDERSILVKTMHPDQNGGKPQLITLLNLDENTSHHLSQIFPDLTKNHFGRCIKMSIPKAPFRIQIHKVESNGDEKYHPKRGYYVTWLEGAMKKLNFTYDMSLSSFDGGTGVQLKNGTWAGAVGDVYNEVAEIAFVIAHIYSRNQYVEWSAPLSYEWIIFVCHSPEVIYSAEAIVWPLRFDSWILFGSCTLFSGIVVKLLFLVPVLDSRNGGQLASKRASSWSVSKIVWYICKSVLEQDAPQPDKEFSWIRAFCGFWLLFVAVGTTAYRAKLVSVLAFPIHSWVPETFEELAESNFMTGLNVVGRGGAAYDLFRSSTSPTFVTIMKKLSLHPNSLECITKAAKEDFCCCI
ncbi:Glutamate receptor ionotropic, delta-1 [Folsomia candida]|uniref:Glutamate receptor ionotropic, delta-1 n=1 Tax=Folsomia candida TaxID=158441 RepID=A0A226E907_FOLCA|nr:Glutamate receptor ionotropic, delta-1 [Folsomia candida]